MKKIKVCSGVSELKKFIEEHKDKKIRLYLAEKTKEAWDISTSRVYMNQIDEKFIYLPINIPKGDWNSIREIYSLAENNNQIVTGYGMNSRNGYVLLQKIQESTGINIPSFEQFAKLVKDAS